MRADPISYGLRATRLQHQYIARVRARICVYVCVYWKTRLANGAREPETGGGSRESETEGNVRCTRRVQRAMCNARARARAGIALAGHVG